MLSSKYEVMPTESCIETRKNKKARLALQKLKLKDFIDLTNHMDIPWEARDQAIGNAYLDIVNLEEALKHTKKVKKSKK